MRVISNFHFWYAITWTMCLIAYSWEWSELNQPLRPDLLTFFWLSIVMSTLILVVQLGRGAANDDRDVVLRSAREGKRDGRSVTVMFVIGFALDFAYQGAIPFFRGGYTGFDITAQIQSTVGIPVLHVVLIGGAIFFALERSDRFFVQRSRSYALQFVVIQILLLLNNSRGYITFCVIGALLLFALRKFSDEGRMRPQILVLAAIGGVVVLFGIGVFGNIRSGSSWWDSSHISHLGRYQDRYPGWLSEQFQWAYTYFTSPLANLNLNLSVRPVDGSLTQVWLAFLPDTFGKYFVAERVNVVYLVSYLNASTGYVVPYYLGGGVPALYVFYILQVVLLELGAFLARKIGTAVALFQVCASVIVIVFVFYNSFSDAATCFLIPLALAVGLVRRRRVEKKTAGGQQVGRAGASPLRRA